tara:strand:+ start:1374 stop:3041 length:1668 start_codon:yes stop_codon:yes gene_type:complete
MQTYRTDSKLIGKGPCNQCGSSDALAIYDDHVHCFSAGCGYHKMVNYDPEKTTGLNIDKLRNEVQCDLDNGWFGKRSEMFTEKVETAVCAAISDRKITQETCKKYDVKVNYDVSGEIDTHYYPYKDLDTGENIGFKVRKVKLKNFHFSGGVENVGFFGQTTCKGSGKFITITEGELDALAVSQMFDNRWDVVSLRGGAGAAVREVKEQLEFLENYENVVLCFDNDKAGQTAIDAVKDIFSPNKLKICKLPSKDACDMLQDNKVKAFQEAWWASKTYQPDGIVAGVDTWEAITGKIKVKSIAYPWTGLNGYTKGFRPFELVTITSGSGMGKSQMVREMEHYLLQSTEDNIGVIALEEDISRTALGIMSVEADCPLHLEEELDAETVKPYWDSTLGTGRFYLFDHWGSTSEDNLLSRIRFMAKALDCKWIILDHLSIVVSSQETDDERRAIDAIMTKLRSLVQELGVGLFLVSHLKRSTGKAHEDGGRISLSELRGSQAIAQLSDIVVGLERDQQDEDEEKRNTTTVRVLKNRYTGLTGVACRLQYNRHTGRLAEVV